MKNFLFKLFIIFIFILNIVGLSANAQSMNISSVVFDNSSSFLIINSLDNFDFNFAQKPVINIDETNKIAYFDLEPALLSGSEKSYIIDSNTIKELNVSQISKYPDIVRVSIVYDNDFNPSDLSLNRINNTLFLKFKNPELSNYYFQDIYNDNSVLPHFENVNIRQKLSHAKNTFGEINSAFTAGNTQTEEILSTKDLQLKTNYYIDSVSLKGSIPILHGIGAYNITTPKYLSSPNRAVFDIKNTIINPALRNKDIHIGQDILRMGQFDRNTARIVISSEKSERYIPVIYSDTQKLAFINMKYVSPLNLYSSTVDMSAVTAEKGDKNNYSMKLTFSNPLVFGVDRYSDRLEIYLYNVENYYVGAIKSEMRNTPFEKIDMSDIKSGGAKLVLPLSQGDSAQVLLGANGKNLRIKVHTKDAYKPTPESVEREVKVPTVTIPAAPVTKRKNGKRYVVIDAGHGGTDYGALRNGINEKDITLDVSKRVEKLLEKKGYVVAMTRTTDTYVSLKGRVEFSEAFNPDIFVSIHVNSSNSDSPTGLETHYYKDNSLMLAKCIHAAMLNNVKSKDRGLFKSRFYVINHTTAPAVLVEIGFISNPWERGQLVTEARKNATAKAIVEGIDEYFRRK